MDLVQAQRWLIGEVTRLDIGRQEVTVEYEGRVKTVPWRDNDA